MEILRAVACLAAQPSYPHHILRAKYSLRAQAGPDRAGSIPRPRWLVLEHPSAGSSAATQRKLVGRSLSRRSRRVSKVRALGAARERCIIARPFAAEMIDPMSSTCR